MRNFHAVTHILVSVVLAAIIAGCAAPKGATIQEKRNYVLEMKSATLSKLYKEEPQAKSETQKSVGYGVFSSINTNLFLFSTARGYGVVKDNRTGKNIYMKMGEVGVGPGLGVKDFREIIIFNNATEFDQFVEKGWDFGGHADAAAKSGEKGGAVGGEVSISEGVIIYTITEAGAALQATVTGVKYWKDDELN
jgi:lipid-binding SYLF domain-containing protein